ncbi:MAG: hypothetical protein DCC43_12730 [Candidatus Brocadia sp.]|jgi:hypothetical protein|uniref:Transcobalamin-like C-terminal domain-containing protein n=1 Tax=Candidatus Brocadia fulgida TaxID=380242 RepID=A0A0M2UXS3_9BACT|nr:MAG: hypothetical protein BROFUL_00635 [Candidatus Brocadia fulgida]MCC6324827.1 DUF4430 domain-containing protein [Candidatus Brocadia sp.]MCE7912709.1 DUF4430 domain-containing protein [Candidatus Brocadia sp. AMX3]OQZ00221.1 MAG: hypothetical protein B6D35_07215 [Candidatus Brocadia sp. UTAMX2]MBV6519636.1 hypothetical protein [Candidatus Brocadia fulgida]
MKRLNWITGIFVFFVFLPIAFCASQKVTVEVDYGGLHQNRKVEIQWKRGITALEALQAVAKVESEYKEEYFLVTSIDNVVGRVGDKVWYYDINGKHATSFANKCILKEGDHVKWKYATDVCSRTIKKGE